MNGAGLGMPAHAQTHYHGSHSGTPSDAGGGGGGGGGSGGGMNPNMGMGGMGGYGATTPQNGSGSGHGGAAGGGGGGHTGNALETLMNAIATSGMLPPHPPTQATNDPVSTSASGSGPRGYFGGNATPAGSAHGGVGSTPMPNGHGHSSAAYSIPSHQTMAPTPAPTPSGNGGIDLSALPPHVQLALLSNLLAQSGGGIGYNTGMAGGDGLGGSGHMYPPPTPQQTRSGRISRPPQYQPLWPMLGGGSGLGLGNGHGQQGQGEGQGQGFGPTPPSMPASGGQGAGDGGQHDGLARAVQLLQQPGMEGVLQVLLNTGFQGVVNGAPTSATPTFNNGSLGVSSAPLQEYADDVASSTVPPSSAAGAALVAAEPPVETGRKRRKRTKDGDGTSGDGVDAAPRRPPRTLPATELDPFPMPPRGKGSRLAMSKEEIGERRRARNKQSALISRTRKQEKVDMLESKEEEVRVLQERCTTLEREVDSLRRYILSSGLMLPEGSISDSLHPLFQSLATVGNVDPSPFIPGAMGPPSVPPPSVPANGPAGLHLSVPMPASTPYDTPGTVNTMNTGAEPMLDFNLFMNLDGFDDDDEFMPETSPQRASDSEGEEDDGAAEGEGGESGDEIDEADDGETTPRAHARLRVGDPERDHGRGKVQGKGKKGAKAKRSRSKVGRGRKGAGASAGNGGETGGYDDDFVDPEMEDEDLFMPIEDVPVPPRSPPSIGAPSVAPQRALPTAGQGPGSALSNLPHDITLDMMRVLRVETRDQLAAVMRKLVDSAGEGGLGVGPDVVERLKSVMYLAQASDRERHREREARPPSGDALRERDAASQGRD